jgi:exosome complex component RRP43
VSHPQAVAQCEDYLHTQLGLKGESGYDTAGSAKMIAEGKLANTAAIASELAAEIYGLQKLAVGIQDESKNFTRFMCLSRVPEPSLKYDCSKGYKTSLCFALNEAPGVLFKALSVFALRDIDLCKIESRPNKNLDRAMLVSSSLQDDSNAQIKKHMVSSQSIEAELSGKKRGFSYFFFIDFLCSKENEKWHNAMRHLVEMAPFVRVLGCYPHHILKTDVSESPAKVTTTPTEARSLRIGIVGFGNFGQFLAKYFLKQGHAVVGTSRTDYTEDAESMGAEFTTSIDTFCTDAKLDVVIVAVSIKAFATVVRKIPWQKFTQNILVVDVLSVKMHAKEHLLEVLPHRFDILASHPMWGPQSGQHSWKGLPFMYDKVRINDTHRLNAFLAFFRGHGCRMISMSCELHDEYAAGSQFITHTTGRALAKLGCENTPINTNGYKQLLDLVANTAGDSFDLYHGLYIFNSHSRQQLIAFRDALEEVRTNLLRAERAYNASVNPEQRQQQDIALNTAVNDMQESKTSQVMDLVANLKRQGQDVTCLNVGEPNFKTPEPIVQAAIKALQDGHTKYTQTVGMLALREAISKKLLEDNDLKYDPSQIIVSCGAKQAIFQSVLALAGSGNEVIIPTPAWVSYTEICTMTGAKPVRVPCLAENNYLLTPQALETAITPSTVALILCTPGNPSGTVYSKNDLTRLATVLRRYPHIIVISDEIYEHLIYDDNQHLSIAALPDMQSRTIIVNGFSKAYAMTGFRLGYAAVPHELKKSFAKIQSQTTGCPSSVSQHAGIAALKMDKKIVQSMVAKYNKNRMFVVAELDKLGSLVTYVRPQGAFYVLVNVSRLLDKTGIVDDQAFCVELLKQQQLALVPGSAFFAQNCVRIVFAADMEILQTGLAKFATFCRTLQQ